MRLMKPSKIGLKHQKNVRIDAILSSVNVNGRFESQNIGMRPEAKNLPTANRGNHRFVPDFFASMDVGKVDFDGRNTDGGNGVPQGETGVGVSGGVQNDHVELAFRLLNPIDEFAFQVGLAEVDFGAEFRRLRPDCLLDVGQRLAAINLRLALSDEVKIRSIEKQDLHRAGRGYLGLGSVSN